MQLLCHPQKNPPCTTFWHRQRNQAEHHYPSTHNAPAKQPVPSEVLYHTEVSPAVLKL